MSAPRTASLTGNENAFGFVQLLAGELSEGRVNLPGIPEVALRVQRALNDEDANIDVVVRAVNAEPTLALQIMRMANSAALSAGAARVQDVRAAVLRVGTQMVRAAALAFLVNQLKNSGELLPLRERLNALWCQGVAVGVTGRVLAARVPGIAPDAALLAGLLHVIGRLYILTRLSRLPALLEEPQAVEKILADWSGNVGKALLENWQMPEEYGEAVANYDNRQRDNRGPIDLTDLLGAAWQLAAALPAAGEAPDEALVAAIQRRDEDLWRRMRLTPAQCRDAVLTAARDAEELRSMFGA
jgi:HD-like signal output (HDOD) protein